MRSAQLDGAAEWQYDPVLEEYHYEQEEMLDSDSLATEELEYRDHVTPLAMSRRMKLGAREAKAEAPSLLEKGVFDSLEITRVLRMMHFPLSQLQRNVVPEGTHRAQEHLFGVVFHLYDFLLVLIIML